MPSDEREQPFVSPKDILGYPNSGPRKRNGGRRQPGRRRILTDTPEKTIIEKKSNLKHLKELKRPIKHPELYFRSHQNTPDGAE